LTTETRFSRPTIRVPATRDPPVAQIEVEERNAHYDRIESKQHHGNGTNQD
jgi:hypothetical protein